MKLKGVVYIKREDIWEARIRFNKRLISIGRCIDPISSHIIYEFVDNEFYGDNMIAGTECISCGEKFKAGGRKICDKCEDKIIELYNSGMNGAEIGRQFNTSSSTITSIIKRNGIKTRSLSHVKGGVPKKHHKEVCELYESGMSTVKLGEQFNVSSHTIGAILKSNNVKIRTMAENQGSIPEEYYDDVVNEYETGKTLVEVGELYGVSGNAVLRVLKLKGVDSRKSTDYTRKVDINIEPLICEDYENGMGNTSLSRKYNINRSTISSILKRNNVKIRTIKEAMGTTQEFEEMICKEYENNKISTRALGKKYGKSKSTICNILKRNKKEIKQSIGENHFAWKGGVSYGKYCEKFNEEFKGRVRKYWADQLGEDKCPICGKKQEEEDRSFAVHHVNYNKEAGCGANKSFFIPMCTGCHGKTNFYRDWWEQQLSYMINTFMDGKTYYKRDEL